MSPIRYCSAVLLFVFCSEPLFGQSPWRFSHRIQAGAERDDNIFETTQTTVGTLAGRLLYRTRLQKNGRKFNVFATYSGGLQLYPAFSVEDKLINNLQANLAWRASDRISLGLALRGDMKLYFEAPLDFANTLSDVLLDIRLPQRLLIEVSAGSSRLDYAETDAFDYTSRRLGLKLSKSFGRSTAVALLTNYERLHYFRQAYALRTEFVGDQLTPLPFRQTDDQLRALLRFSFGRKFVVHLSGEFLKNYSNSFGYGYAQFRLSAVAGAKLSRLWLFRLAAMRQIKNYTEDIAPILPINLDAENDESNFIIGDLSYNYSPNLAYLVRLALYNNEATLRGMFYRKTQLFIGAEYRF